MRLISSDQPSPRKHAVFQRTRCVSALPYFKNTLKPLNPSTPVVSPDQDFRNKKIELARSPFHRTPETESNMFRDKLKETGFQNKYM